MHYLGVGGHCDIFDIDAHLHGLVALDSFEHDTLAYATNEYLDGLATSAHIPYLQQPAEPPPRLRQVIAELLDGE